MLIDPVSLFDEAIGKLHDIRELLADEFDERIHGTALTPDGKLCKETYLAITVLLPKLRAARATQVNPEDRQRPLCLNCD
jgi:hypothetical protein